MSKKHVLFIIAIFCFQNLYAQNALTMLKFEQAEQAFNNGNYTKVLQHLDEVEKQVGVTSKTLYLRVVSENKLFNDGEQLYEDESNFNKLLNLRKHSKAYLTALGNEELDSRYREVYRITTTLDEFPQSKTEWLSARKDVLLNRAEQARLLKAQKKDELRREISRKATEEFKRYAKSLIAPSSVIYNQLSKITTSVTTPNCTVYFFRKPKMSGRIVNSKLFLHHEYMFPLATKKYKKVLLTPGMVKLNALHGTLPASAKNINSKQFTETTLCFNAKANQVYYVNVELVKYVNLNLVDEEEGKKYISEYEEME